VRTLIIIVLGFALLAICIGAARALAGGDKAQVAKAIWAFIALWFFVAAGNLWTGIVKIGSDVLRESLIFVLTFGLPAGIAYFINWKSSEPPLDE